jgi:tRNA 5-methylaminomethyl-2-thiouridine biosynthesis bifunctional protein
MKPRYSLQPAKLGWRQGVPYSDVFDDLYFAREGGLEESRYVFLENNDLPQRWKNYSRFTVAETGFGTGLNFLSTLALWSESAPDYAQLHYISAEKHPFTKTDLSLALEFWPYLSRYCKELLKVYPELVPGYHRRELANRRVTLTLLFGDALELYTQLRAEVDAWYLDGFAPSKNPQMWIPKLFQQIARLSHPGTTFSTFTAAGMVRRGLQEVGFEVSKFPGFGAKRDMLRGVMGDPTQKQKAVNHLSDTPWYDVPAQPIQTGTNAIVVGAGLAGISAAHALARRNWTVAVFERHNQFAQEASGNLAGIAMPRLTADMSAEGRFYLAAFLHSIHLPFPERNLPGFCLACRWGIASYWTTICEKIN